MNKARLIKKTELTESKPPTPPVWLAPTPRPVPASNTHKTLSQWVGAYQNSSCPNPRAAFAALFNAET